MKNAFGIFVVAAILATTMAVSSCQKNPKPDQPAKYTIMLYGCGGANVDIQLEAALDGAVRALGVEKNQVRFTVMYSMSATDKAFDPAYCGEKGKTYRYELSKDTDLTQSGYRSKYFYKNASEVELYKSSTLEDFIKWSVETAPAENYILELVNHGGGFDLDTEVLNTKGIAYDDNHPDDNGYAQGIAISTIANALKKSGVHMKAIYWYGCMMGQLEVLTEVAPYCDYQFTSSHVARADYTHVLSLINALNDEPADFEKAALKHKTYLEGQGEDDENSFFYPFSHAINDEGKVLPENCDFGCWRSAKVSAINEQVKKLGALLVKAYKTEKMYVDYATSWVYLYELTYGYADVLDYAQNLVEALEDEGLRAEARTIAADMKQAIADANVYRVNGVFIKDAHGTPLAPRAGTFSVGISLYAGMRPDDKQYAFYSANYKASAFDKATSWSKWMDINEFRVSADELHPNVTNPANDSSWILFWLEE